jgi:hypothetical protein
MRALTKDEVRFVSGGIVPDDSGQPDNQGRWPGDPNYGQPGELGVGSWFTKLVRDAVAWMGIEAAAKAAYNAANINMGTCPTGYVKQNNGTCLQFPSNGGVTFGGPGNGHGQPTG